MNKFRVKTIQLIGLAFLVKGLGFIREVILAYFYGTSTIVDVYIASINIPSVIFGIIGVAITTSFIPIYSEVKSSEGDIEAMRFANNMLNILLILSSIIAFLGIVYSDWLVKIFVGGFQGEAYNMCSIFTKISMITIVFTVVQYIYNGFLQIQGEFNQNSIMMLPYNIILIISIILGWKLNKFIILPIGVVLASMSQVLYLKYRIQKTNFKHIPFISLNNKYIKKTLILISPIFLSTAINELNIIVDRSMASRCIEGSISALNYSNKINSIFLEVVILSITTIVYPTLSQLFSEGKNKELNKWIEKYMYIIILICFPIALLINFLSVDIIRILFERGAFGKYEVEFTAAALKIISIGLISFALRDALNKVFYSLKDTKTPTKNGIISILINISLNILLVYKFSYLGLAFSTVLSSSICTILLFKSLLKQIKCINFNYLFKEIPKIIISSIIMYLSLIMIDKIILITRALDRCIIFGIIAIVTYVITLMIMGATGAKSMAKKLKIRIKGGLWIKS